MPREGKKKKQKEKKEKWPGAIFFFLRVLSYDNSFIHHSSPGSESAKTKWREKMDDFFSEQAFLSGPDGLGEMDVGLGASAETIDVSPASLLSPPAPLPAGFAAEAASSPPSVQSCSMEEARKGEGKFGTELGE